MDTLNYSTPFKVVPAGLKVTKVVPHVVPRSSGQLATHRFLLRNIEIAQGRLRNVANCAWTSILGKKIGHFNNAQRIFKIAQIGIMRRTYISYPSLMCGLATPMIHKYIINDIGLLFTIHASIMGSVTGCVLSSSVVCSTKVLDTK